MKNQDFARAVLSKQASLKPSGLALGDGSRVAVMGGGPAGSLFSYFLLEMADRDGLSLHLDIYEPRDFSMVGPRGCNMCAGIISESLIQMLAVEGINLPPTVVQRGTDSYVLHNKVGSVRLNTPFMEKRVATVFRGTGPLQVTADGQSSFDAFLLEQAVQKGANRLQNRVVGVNWADDGRVLLKIQGEPAQSYDFLAVATGVNSSALKLFEKMDLEFQPPGVSQTYLREYFLGKEMVERLFGHTIHFFMLDLKGLDFAAVIPKGECVTICLLGKDLDQGVFESFLNTPQVKSCLPPGWQAEDYICHCCPRINIMGATHPFGDRIVFLGDTAVSRLYKDGIGAAYRAAKAASAAATFDGISEQALERSYGRYSKEMERDNAIGKRIFAVVGVMKSWRFTSRAVLEMISNEQSRETGQQRMSAIMWDMLTGSAPYSSIALRIFHPAFWSRFVWHVGVSALRGS